MHRWSAKLFSLLGIRIEVHVTFLLLLGLFTWQGYEVAGLHGIYAAMISLVLLFTSVLLHELGHCVVAQRYGIPVPKILLLPIGGVAMMGSIPRQPKAELAITLAGPAVNFVIAGILFALVGRPPDFWPHGMFSTNLIDLAHMLIVWNVTMGLFNLIPVFPMDGGRIFRALLATKFNYLDATRIATYTAKGLVIVGIGFVLLYSHNYLMAALFAFIWMGGEMEYQQVRLDETYRGLTIRDITIAWLGGENDPALTNRPALSASWPLEFYGRMFEADFAKVYPVYDEKNFIGVVDTSRLKAALKVARLRRSNPEYAILTSGSSDIDR